MLHHVLKMDQLQFVKLEEGARIPTRATEGSVGYDVYSLFDTVLLAGERKCIRTGIAMNLPSVKDGLGYYPQLKGRSSLELKGIDLKAGVVDCDYRGEILVLLKNDTDDDYFIKAEDRIAQMIITPFIAVHAVEVQALDDTARGTGGFGSTSR